MKACFLFLWIHLVLTWCFIPIMWNMVMFRCHNWSGISEFLKTYPPAILAWSQKKGCELIPKIVLHELYVSKNCVGLRRLDDRLFHPVRPISHTLFAVFLASCIPYMYRYTEVWYNTRHNTNKDTATTIEGRNKNFSKHIWWSLDKWLKNPEKITIIVAAECNAQICIYKRMTATRQLSCLLWYSVGLDNQRRKML